MGEEEGCENRKSDVASLGRKLKFHLLVYTSRKPVRSTRNISNLINLMLYNININRKTNEAKTTIRTLLEKSLGTTKL